MISIIISSYKKSYFTQVVADVEQTVGVPYEIIKIHNPKLYSITQAYNIGAVKAKYDILCFMHEDIIFKTINWGQILIQHFINFPDLGLIGVAGSAQKPALPTGWINYKDADNKLNLVQHFRDGVVTHLLTKTDLNIDFVKTLDGVFLATKKEVWNAVKFDETIEGFHLYDIDFSLRVGKLYKIAVIYNIIIEHFSQGFFDDEWLKATINYHKNNKHSTLFDADADDNWRHRKHWYTFLLTHGKSSLKVRYQYLNAMGIDIRSAVFAWFFLFPAIGKPVFNFYLKSRELLKAKQ